MGDDYSVKDLRTWHGTVLAAEAFVDADPPVSKAVVKRVESAVMKEVAEALGNTPAVARGSYVDPRVVAGYESEVTIAAASKRAARCRDIRDRAGDPGQGHSNAHSASCQELTTDLLAGPVSTGRCGPG